MPELYVLLLIAAIAAFVQGFGGFGFGIVAMSLLAFTAIDLERGAAIITLACIPLLLLLFFLSRQRGRPRWRLCVLILLGTIIGQPFGYRFLETGARHPLFMIVFGGVLLWFAIQGFQQRLTTRLPYWTSFPTGILSGFITGAFASGGPPVVLYLFSQVKDPREMISTLQVTFLLGAFVRVGLVATSERGIDLPLLRATGLCIAVMAPVLVGAYYLARRCSTRVFTRVVYAGLGICGIGAIFRAF